MKTRTALAATLLAVAALPALTPGAAVAKSDDDKIRQGVCSERSDWKIKAKPDDNRIEVEAEIDSNVNGQTWKWVLKHNGDVSSRGRSTTKAPSGSFEVERKTVDAAGTDRFTFRATHPASGETCVARIRL